MAHSTDTNDRTNRETTASQQEGLSDFLERDNAVESLDDTEVMDCWARGQFMHEIIRANGPEYMRSDECEQVRTRLEEYDNSGLIEVAIHALGRTHPLVQSLGWENGPGNVKTLFDKLTTDDKDEEELVQVARKQLKEALRGSGMPRIRVMRERVEYHANGKENGGA
jgi:hypothetical protein